MGFRILADQARGVHCADGCAMRRAGVQPSIRALRSVHLVAHADLDVAEATARGCGTTSAVRISRDLTAQGGSQMDRITAFLGLALSGALGCSGAIDGIDAPTPDRDTAALSAPSR